MKILLVEDEIDLNNIIKKYLKTSGYIVDSVFDGEEALFNLNEASYDLVILDVMLPKLSGFEVLEKMRKKNNKAAVLMLTSKDQVEDKIKGLDLGADDYLSKPFDFEELAARIRAIIRRRYDNLSSEIKIHDLILDTMKKTVIRNNVNIDLTGKEYEILEYLMQNKERIVSRDQIKDHVYDFYYEGSSNVIDVLIKNIRKKIDLEGSKQIIFTKKGLGYVVKENEN
ncbi:response regulator transcription factor [Streptobacillus moniliformis]|uniref:Two component transcriptional regulator, winged helix family n=1 Tax=Streptobacillus moniliformis (strain ATCC 14647 / DSM 12112 / NCTC 10651 / 9901) TaxID=519441 RepID=D1AW12_STRM9|nr:response regulator transcription factor [Streptobacillus moniliformis]ACZ01922.1 two component transcriptional regulator, winged helix family [Streptobacillus moniliformis DSM 12112]AVL43091.1 DNA-binding response regulator [Streptobacillus moniliformis]QXW65263.1 response regulator transcription factor [Streptobacillus moniliformis]SQA12870.1 Transcriptional activator protein CopR [Streptobacillus moniliformis]